MFWDRRACFRCSGRPVFGLGRKRSGLSCNAILVLALGLTSLSVFQGLRFGNAEPGYGIANFGSGFDLRQLPQVLH